jgi:hypothetical protein
MARKTEQYILIADENGEPFYASLEELAFLAQRNEDFAFKLEHDFQDEDGYGYD